MQKKNEQDIMDAKKQYESNSTSIVFTARIRVQRKEELENDFEMKKLYYKRLMSKVLEDAGYDVRGLYII